MYWALSTCWTLCLWDNLFLIAAEFGLYLIQTIAKICLLLYVAGCHVCVSLHCSLQPNSDYKSMASNTAEVHLELRQNLALCQQNSETNLLLPNRWILTKCNTIREIFKIQMLSKDVAKLHQHQDVTKDLSWNLAAHWSWPWKLLQDDKHQSLLWQSEFFLKSIALPWTYCYSISKFSRKLVQIHNWNLQIHQIRDLISSIWAIKIDFSQFTSLEMITICQKACPFL